MKTFLRAFTLLPAHVHYSQKMSDAREHYVYACMRVYNVCVHLCKSKQQTLDVCMCVNALCLYDCVHVYMCMCVYARTCWCGRAYLCVCVCVRVCVYACAC